jgi:hypothetical protein
VLIRDPKGRTGRSIVAGRAPLTFECNNDLVNETLEGWYTDPFARHEARWMSEGAPTDLVRDGDVEATDPVTPNEAFKMDPVRIEGEGALTGSGDLRRADDAERQPAYDPQEAIRRGLDAIDQGS